MRPVRTYSDEYERLLPLVEKPGRYLGNERGAVRKDLSTIPCRFALAFPEVYEIAQSHLGLQVLYDILNRRDDVAAERCYAPWPDFEKLLRDRGLPLASLEGGLALCDFDVVGFSLQYELTYTNLLTMLELGGIPLRAADRTAAHPIVIAGGPCAFNPEPLAPFLDAVLLGDGEEAVGQIAEVVAAGDRSDRPALLRQLANLAGVYVPSLFVPRYHADGTVAEVVPLDPERPVVRKRILPDLNAFPPPKVPVVPNIGVVHDRASVEVMRGCVKGCRFCQAGYVYRPLRERDPEQVVAHTKQVVRDTGYEEVSLLSLSTGDYSGVNPVLKDLMDTLTPERVSVSLPSTRVDALDPRILDQIRRVRKTSFTIAPEAGTQRLRDVIQKEYKEEELLAAAKLFADLGWRAVKLYFMIGLPSETEADVRGIALLAEKVRRAAGNRLKVTASVSTFSPKPHTPFQWAGELSIEETQVRQSLLRYELSRRGVEFRWHDSRLTMLEGVFARGDRRLADVLETAQRRGARFDGWSEFANLDLWLGILAEHGLDAEFYLRRRSLDEVLPWDHLDAGLSKRFLRQELARAVEGVLTPDCSIERCTYCGACDFESVTNVDFHTDGAKGGDHRGTMISRWAETLVPSEDDSGRPGWETKTWHEIRAKVAERRAARRGVERPSDGATPMPEPERMATSAPAPSAPAGDGNADEWLGAVSSSLTPDAGNAPPVQRLRLRYRKIGPARFIGTREIGNVFLRAARRADLPLAFSQGHHPHPKLGFGPALPLGHSSDDEFVDVELTARLAPAALLAAFQHELPDGLHPIDVVEIPRALPSIDGDIEAFVWDVALAPLDAPPADADVRDAVEGFARGDEFRVTKRTKQGERRVDARPFVRQLTITGAGRLRLELHVGKEGSLKPELVIGELLGIPPADRPLVRIHKIATRFRSPVPAPAEAAVA